MNSRLNYSTLEDAWGLPVSENSKSDMTAVPLDKKFKYRKSQENILSIDSNERDQSLVDMNQSLIYLIVSSQIHFLKYT